MLMLAKMALAAFGGGETVFDAPNFIAAGTFVSGQSALSPGIPAGTSEGDLLLLTTVCDDGQTVPAPTDWSELATAVVNSGSLSTERRKLQVFFKYAEASESAPTLADASGASDVTCAQIFGFGRAAISGVDTGTITSSTTAVSFGSVTTEVPNEMVVQIVANGNDSSAAQVSGWTNAALDDLTEQVDNNSSTGNGGGFALATGVMIEPGAIGSTTATLANASHPALITIRLRPEETTPPLPVIRAVGTPYYTKVDGAFALDMPDGVVAGDRLFAFLVRSNTVDVSTVPSGWDKAYENLAPDPTPSSSSILIATKIATGSEGASQSFTFATSQNPHYQFAVIVAFVGAAVPWWVSEVFSLEGDGEDYSVTAPEVLLLRPSKVFRYYGLQEAETATGISVEPAGTLLASALDITESGQGMMSALYVEDVLTAGVHPADTLTFDASETGEPIGFSFVVSA